MLFYGFQNNNSHNNKKQLSPVWLELLPLIFLKTLCRMEALRVRCWPTWKEVRGSSSQEVMASCHKTLQGTLGSEIP